MSVDNNGYWPYRVDIGDILEDGNGRLRTVVKATQGKSGLTTCVVFPILHRSWTGRAHTFVTYTDLKVRGFRPTGRRLSRIPVLMTRVAIDAGKSPSVWPPCVSASDVIGVLR